MKTQNNPKKPAGFGFGDAMFAIKDLTDDYGQFNAPPPDVEPAVSKNPLVKPPPSAAKKPAPMGGNKLPGKPVPIGGSKPPPNKPGPKGVAMQQKQPTAPQ